MMSARAYASKYPGKPVRLSAIGQKEFRINDEPIGIVVGWRAGRLGVIGSSKVAIYRASYRECGLQFYTDRKYNTVIPDAPESRKGIYLLSVNYIEQLTAPKAVKLYPDSCKICKQPARRGSNIVVCSNSHCKSKKAVFSVIGPIPKIYSTDKEGYVLCPMCQAQDKINCREYDFTDGNDTYRNFICCKKRHRFTHTWKEGQKIIYKGERHYIWKNNQLTSLHVMGLKHKKKLNF